jgi:hypothetical protein
MLPRMGGPALRSGGEAQRGAAVDEALGGRSAAGRRAHGHVGRPASARAKRRWAGAVLWAGEHTGVAVLQAGERTSRAARTDAVLRAGEHAGRAARRASLPARRARRGAPVRAAGERGAAACERGRMETSGFFPTLVRSLPAVSIPVRTSFLN